MYYLKSVVYRLNPEKQREARDRIVAGVKVHSKKGAFPIPDMAAFENYDHILELAGVGEIQVVDGKNNNVLEQFKEDKAKYDASLPKVVEPAPEESEEEEPEEEEPEEEPEEEAPSKPEKPVSVEPSEEKSEEEEPEEDEESEGEYTKEDLEAMTKEDLLEMAGDLGIEDKVHHRDLKAKIVKEIWKVL